jgi:hypothetical protein
MHRIEVIQDKSQPVHPPLRNNQRAMASPPQYMPLDTRAKRVCNFSQQLPKENTHALWQRLKLFTYVNALLINLCAEIANLD